MAVSPSNYSLLPPRLSASFSLSTKHSKALALSQPLHYHHRPHLCKPILGFLPLPNSSPITMDNKCRRFFKSYFSSQDSAPTANGIEEASQNGVKTSESGDQNHLSSLKALINVYKDAILVGDEKIVSDIEARVHIIESEWNELTQKVSALSLEITSGKEKYIRLQADFDNFRKRSEKERLTIRSDAQGEVIESLLPMVDNFERAKQQLKLETEKEKKIDASYQGIYKQFVEIMRSLHVAAVATVGKPFDPSLHEAIAREESHEFKEGIVIEEFRRGFQLGQRLLRPAMVKVSSGPGSKKVQVAADSNKSTEQTATGAGVDEV
ncbi:protein GrpE [Juglans microcarpa x Juglans regia]|uniref:protein GrpE n=1 Tax=Juglans microcarpa x Juglans regia TaxID=2249226 RepID=UPI001B7F26E3|nr:protein GrpE [Juglans microcarpa x Juglans regia]